MEDGKSTTVAANIKVSMIGILIDVEGLIDLVVMTLEQGERECGNHYQNAKTIHFSAVIDCACK
jgi:hypothetical protein